MATPKTLVLTGYGINCDEETKYAFELAGSTADIVHINELIDKHKRLDNYQILAFPGGFSYGDDTGSGIALANRIRNHLWDEMLDFVNEDHLAIGICNGFQVMVNLGLLPGIFGDYGERNVALVHNESARYVDRWVDLKFSGRCIWTRGIEYMTAPIAHGEGKFFASEETLNQLHVKGLVAARYVRGEICEHTGLPRNPNGSLENIAGITDASGRLFGLMPHPERAIDFTHHPHWTLLKEQLKREGKEIPRKGPGLELFEDGVSYFR